MNSISCLTFGCGEGLRPQRRKPGGATTAEKFGNFHSACETNYPDGDGVLTIDLTDFGSQANLPPKPDIS
jgi:hypothetical protein